MLVVVGVMALGFRASALPIVSLVLTPEDGLLAGQAGTAVGWGYTLTTTSDFVTIQSITFGDTTPVGVFSTPGIPFTAASVGSPIIVPWFVNISGLQYDISALALLGASTQGPMTLIYDAYTDEGLSDQIVFGETVNAQLQGIDVTAQVDVNAEAAQTVPEPATMGLIGIGCVALAAWRVNWRLPKSVSAISR